MQDIMTLPDVSDIPERIQKIFNQVDEVEQQYLLQILEELSETGESKTYNEIWLSDYKEIPVDWDTFASNDYYLGKATNQGTGIYPFWMEEANKFFAPDSEFYEWILTGATRIGKTSTAVKAAAYTLYLVMCLRDPQKYFNKLEISKFSILFFNITKDQAKGVAFREFNDTLAVSPWFQEHGTFSTSEDNFVYRPEGGKIVIEFGSSAAHGLGKQVLIGFLDECLVGDTVVVTPQGLRRLGDLEGKLIPVYHYDRANHVKVQGVGRVQKSAEVDTTIRITLENGSTIEGTPEHLMLLSNGQYKKLKDLTGSDDIAEVAS